MARALRQEGLSQAEIGRELGVSQRTISRWLKATPGEGRVPEMGNAGGNTQNGLSGRRPPRYLVVQGSVEKFRPPDGVVFPLIIAGLRGPPPG
jgi:hypothetical protein